MADNPVANVDTLAGKVLDALADVLKSGTSPEVLQAQQLLLRRVALEGDVVPSRIPAPRNITEIGGYLNLLASINQIDLRNQALAAIMGVAGPNPMPGLTPTGQVLFDVVRVNDRPAGPAQAGIPTQFRIRNDFAASLDAALKTIHDAGCTLPIQSAPLGLPPAGPSAPKPTDVLRYLGRTLDLVASAALNDPDADPLAVARPQGAPDLAVVARQVDSSAPQAASVPSKKWIAWQCDDTQCTESMADRSYLPLAPILNAAGWYQPKPGAPTKLSSPGTWARWTNITGLTTGVSTLGDELSLRYSPSELAASSLRDATGWKWNGADFVA